MTDSSNHPIFEYLQNWVKLNSIKHEVELKTEKTELTGGDILFLISYYKILKSDIRQKFLKTLVIHASDLPAGKGMSPLTWQILEGKNKIIITFVLAKVILSHGVMVALQILDLPV